MMKGAIFPNLCGFLTNRSRKKRIGGTLKKAGMSRVSFRSHPNKMRNVKYQSILVTLKQKCTRT